jgi:hypothetical protein
LAVLCCLLVPPAAAQTASDTAAVILNTARRLEREGRPTVARELFRFLRLRYAGTPAAAEADSLLRSLPSVVTAGAGRTGFVLFNTLYGAFLGVAIPAAFSADGSEPYGLGLLVGAPLGYFGARSFSKGRFKSPGQAGIASFATMWGTWQGVAIQQAAGIGDDEFCDPQFGCYTTDSDTAPWAAMVVGGLAGLATGWALAASKEIPAGTSTLVSHSAFWGTWFGLSVGRATGIEDDQLLWSMIVAGNAGLMAAIPAAASWRPSSSRVRLITAGGIAGGLVGFGIDLLASFDDSKTVLGVPAATSALGLIIGAFATANRRDLDAGSIDDFRPQRALVDATDGLRIGIPLPEPAAFRLVDRAGRSIRKAGARVVLFEGTF